MLSVVEQQASASLRQRMEQDYFDDGLEWFVGGHRHCSHPETHQCGSEPVRSHRSGIQSGIAFWCFFSR